MTKLIVDTGFLVSLYIRADSLHQTAIAYLRQNRLPLQTVTAVIVETCFFLDAAGKVALLSWISHGGIEVIEIPIDNYLEIGAYIKKYADQDIDFTDAALVWLANQTGCKKILTVDEKDFNIYRLEDGSRFELLRWY